MGPARDQPERIDLIDVDPVVFDDAARTAHASSRRLQALRAVGAVGVLAVAVVVWWPRAEPPEWRVYQTAPVPAVGLTDELVFDQPPGPLVSADLAPPPYDVKPDVGYVFGDPEGSILTRRWASFRSRTTGADDAPPATDVPNVDGAPVLVQSVRVRQSVEWGPVQGRQWWVETNRFEDGEALEFANHVAVIDGKPAVAQQYDLGVMQPVGSIAAFDCVVHLKEIFQGERSRGASLPTIVTWETDQGALSIASIAAPKDALPMVEFVLGVGNAITVHGLPAVAIDSRTIGPLVGWVEDGRLITVVGPRSLDELAAVAETVRPATEAEWQRVTTLDELQGDVIGTDLGDSVALYQATDKETGDITALTIRFFDGVALMCVVQQADLGFSRCQSTGGELPLLTVIEADEQRWVLAVAEPMSGVSIELRIKLAEGTWTLPLHDYGPGVPGVGVATPLPTDYGVIELWVGDKVVAQI